MMLMQMKGGKIYLGLKNSYFDKNIVKAVINKRRKDVGKCQRQKYF